MVTVTCQLLLVVIDSSLMDAPESDRAPGPLDLLRFFVNTFDYPGGARCTRLPPSRAAQWCRQSRAAAGLEPARTPTVARVPRGTPRGAGCEQREPAIRRPAWERHAALPRRRHGSSLELRPDRGPALEPAGAGTERAIAVTAGDRLRRASRPARGRGCAPAGRTAAVSRTTIGRRTARERGAAWRFAETARKRNGAARASATTNDLTDFVAHFDVDAFYASVAVRDDPSLRGKPVAIAGSSRRAVVLTASYEARPFGVRSAMPLYKARAACPQLVVVAPEMAKYKAVSREIFAVFGARGHAVEGLSLDEAFVDAGDGAISTKRARWRPTIRARRPSSDRSNGERRRREPRKMVAKIASDACKPNGLLAIAPGDEATFLAPLPVGRLWGIGPKTQRRLSAFGIETDRRSRRARRRALARILRTLGRAAFANSRADATRAASIRSAKRNRSRPKKRSSTTCATSANSSPFCARRRSNWPKSSSAKMPARAPSALKSNSPTSRIVGRQTHLVEPTRAARAIFRAAVVCLRRAQLERRAGAPARHARRIARRRPTAANRIVFDCVVLSRVILSGACAARAVEGPFARTRASSSPSTALANARSAQDDTLHVVGVPARSRRHRARPVRRRVVCLPWKAARP